MSEGPLFIYLKAALGCMDSLGRYILPCLAALLAARAMLKPKPYVFRKLLHMVAFSSACLTILAAEIWQAPALCFMAVALLIYPILAALEGSRRYADFFVEKEPGEVKLSLLLLFFTVAAVSAVGWGLFGHREAAAGAVLIWGTGDAAAALVGIPFGRHRLNIGFSGGKKTLEGTLADFAAGLAFGAAFFTLFCGIEPGRALPAALIGAAAGAFTELISPSEYDTATVPAAVLAALLIALR